MLYRMSSTMDYDATDDLLTFKNIFTFSLLTRNYLLTFAVDALRKLEERGVVIRFVIGRRFFLAL